MQMLMLRKEWIKSGRLSVMIKTKTTRPIGQQPKVNSSKDINRKAAMIVKMMSTTNTTLRRKVEVTALVMKKAKAMTMTYLAVGKEKSAIVDAMNR